MSGPLLAAFLSGIAWAGLDVVRKKLARDASPVVIATCLSLGLTALFGLWTLLSGFAMTVSDYWLPAAVSVVLSLIVQLSILESVRRGALSRTIPLLSMTPVATALFGRIVLDERLDPRQWAGVVLVFVGAAALGSSGGGRRFRLDGSAWIMLLAALCISAAAPFDKLAVGAASPALHGFIQSLVSAAVLVAFLAWSRRLRSVAALFAGRPSMTVASLLALAALGLQLVAYQGVLVGVVETIKRVVGLVSSLVAGRLVFGERITWNTLAAIGLMAAGTALLLA